MKRVLTLVFAMTIVTGCSNPSHHSKHDDHGSEAEGHHHHFDEPEKYAEKWNDPARTEWQKPAEVMELMDLRPGMTAVDLGAGTGYFVPYLAAEVAPDGRVLALDVEEAMIEWLETQKREKGWSFVEPQRVAFDDPELQKQSVDRVLTVNTWHHIEGRKAYAQKLASALKPGGMVVVVDFEPAWEGDGPPPEMRLESAEIIADFSSAGLQTEVIEESLPRQYVVIARKD